MAVLIRVNHKDEPYPEDQAVQLLLAQRATTQDYVLKHPLFAVEFRARQHDGRGRGVYYCPPGDYQVRVCGRPWPSRWVETTDLVGEIHDLGFDLTGPRGGAAREAFRRRVQRALARFGIEDDVS